MDQKQIRELLEEALAPGDLLRADKRRREIFWEFMLSLEEKFRNGILTPSAQQFLPAFRIVLHKAYFEYLKKAPHRLLELLPLFTMILGTPDIDESSLFAAVDWNDLEKTHGK